MKNKEQWQREKDARKSFNDHDGDDLDPKFVVKELTDVPSEEDIRESSAKENRWSQNHP